MRWERRCNYNAHVEYRRSLVALRNRLIWVSSKLCAADYMTPQHAYPVAALDGNHLRGDGLLEVGIARDVCVVDVLDRVVGQRGADSDCFAVIDAIHAVVC